MTPALAKKIEQFFSNYRLREFDRGQVIIQAEEDPAGVFYLIQGRVSQYDISLGGTEVVVNIFKAPAFFPMSWAINKTPNRYFFEAATKVIVRQAPPKEVIEFIKANPDVLLDLLSRVFIGTDGLLRRMAHLMVGDARKRLLFELMIASYRFGEQNPDGSVFVALNESDLAKHTGLVRETVNRSMQKLKSSGLVEVGRNGILLKDISKLEKELGADI